MKPKFKIEDEEILDGLEDGLDDIWCREYYYYLDNGCYFPESYLRRVLYVRI